MTHSKKRILVTGGAGFVGSHLCEKLLALGAEVFCLDNFYTGRKENIDHLFEHPRFEFFEHDVCSPIQFQVDEIYNLACPASPIHYQKDPIFTMKTSVFGAIHLLELAQKNRCKILQASTSEVYGDPHVHPQPETYWGHVNPVGTRSCYDEGKRAAETLFFDYFRTRGVRIKIARIFNTYGPRMDPQDGRVVSNFIVQALQDLPLTIYGNGTQTRSFCYVDDLVQGLIQLMNSPDSFLGPVNLGNPIEYLVLDLAQEILRKTSSSSPIHYHPLPSDDPKQRKPDISLAKQKLNWIPTIDLQIGLDQTIAYFKQFLKIPAPS
jgi:UDP-glucuronate decarboxylase